MYPVLPANEAEAVLYDLFLGLLAGYPGFRHIHDRRITMLGSNHWAGEHIGIIPAADKHGRGRTPLQLFSYLNRFHGNGRRRQLPEICTLADHLIEKG